MSRNVKPPKKLITSSVVCRERLLVCALSALCLFLLLRHSNTAISHMSRGLRLCAGTVIPSLFPFMVLSELTVSSGCGLLLGKLCDRPMRRLFGISGAGACALIMGLICGFPTGAKTAVSLRRHNQISPLELSRLICFGNIPSAAFLINVVGVSLFHNRRFGIMLYVICVFVSLWSAWLMHRIRPLSTQENLSVSADAPLHARIFTNAITSATASMLYVCAYVVFFTAVVGTLGELLRPLATAQTWIAALSGIFELSGGIMETSEIANYAVAGCLTAFLCGWSGMSVHLQILSLCDELPASDIPRIRPYLLCKLIQGILCALLCGCILYFFPSFRPISGQLSSATTLPAFRSTQGILLIYATLIFTTFAFLRKYWFKNDIFRTTSHTQTYTIDEGGARDELRNLHSNL